MLSALHTVYKIVVLIEYLDKAECVIAIICENISGSENEVTIECDEDRMRYSLSYLFNKKYK